MFGRFACAGTRSRRLRLFWSRRRVQQTLEEMKIARIEVVMEQAHAEIIRRSATCVRFRVNLGVVELLSFVLVLKSTS